MARDHLIPCPTLSVAVGVNILLCGLGSRVWSLTIVAASMFYGVFGWLYLGVRIDLLLLGGALALLALVLPPRVAATPTGA
jgi:hypothetical protein